MLPLNSPDSTTRPTPGEARVRPLLIRILKNGLLTAVLLAALGYALAEFATAVLGTQTTPRSTADLPAVSADDLTIGLKGRMPLTLAAWGFGLVAVIEVLRHLLRGGKRALAAKPAAAVVDETAKLLNELLEKADAERQRAAACPATPPADNTGAI